MPDDKLVLLLKRFAVAAVAHHEALEAMDEGRANSHAGMVDALHKALLRQGEAGQEGLLTLLENASPVVAGMAAVYALHLYPDRCLAVLRKVATEPGLLGFRARVAVELWEAGEWMPPQGR